MAADFSAPSFSLGLDLDFDEEDQQESQEEPSIPNPANEEEEEDLDLGKTLDRDDLEEHRRPALKRLRRGPPTPAPTAFADEGNVNLDDDIEDFSSEEGEDRRHQDISSSLPSQAPCSSSKISLQHHGVLTSQSASKFKTPKITKSYNASTSTSFDASSSKCAFPSLTISPLRKIHLVDSDSDTDDSPNKGKVNSKGIDPSNKKGKEDVGKTFQSRKHETESFWKGLGPKEDINLATPALDEFCNEYFKSAKDQKVGHCKEYAPSFCSSKVLDPDDSVDDFEVLFEQKSCPRQSDHSWDFPHPQPPAYQYFFHDDTRIRALIRQRLPHFTPIGAESQRGPQLLDGDELDYMGQFNAGEGPSQGRATNQKYSVGNSKTKQKKPSTAKRKEVSQATGDWINPRSSAPVPKDAGKRRVSAVGSQGSGRWYTGQDGRKVYVSKNGQKLTGQIAWKQHKKDNGTRFRKGKKKATTKSKRK